MATSSSAATANGATVAAVDAGIVAHSSSSDDTPIVQVAHSPGQSTVRLVVDENTVLVAGDFDKSWGRMAALRWTVSMPPAAAG